MLFMLSVAPAGLEDSLVLQELLVTNTHTTACMKALSYTSIHIRNRVPCCTCVYVWCVYMQLGPMRLCVLQTKFLCRYGDLQMYALKVIKYSTHT